MLSVEVVKSCILEGGEIMNFRHFILMGVFLGAAAFLPNNVFAEKNIAAGPAEPQNSAVQTVVSEKIENPIASENAVPVTPENVHKSQVGVVQKPVTRPNTEQRIPIESSNKMNRVVEKVVPSVEKNIKASEPTETAAKVKEPGKSPAKSNDVTNGVPEVSKPLPSNQTDSEADTNSQPAGLNAKSGTITEDSHLSVSMKTSSSLTLTEKQPIDGENKNPSNNRKIPGYIEIMNNPPQRTQSSGGQLNDQLSPGAGELSFIAYWFDWDEHFALNLGRMYTARQAKYYHQWINAPPSPPPKAASFFNVYC